MVRCDIYPPDGDEDDDEDSDELDDVPDIF